MFAVKNVNSASYSTLSVPLVMQPARWLMLLALLLVGCSSTPPRLNDYPVDAASLPSERVPQSTSGTAATLPVLTLASLEQGNHHPAIAALFKKAEQARQQRQWRKALKYLDQARQIQPRNAGVLYRQAWVNLQLGQASQAEQLLRRAKVFSANNDTLERRLDWLLADALDAQGKAGAARAARQRATR